MLNPKVSIITVNYNEPEVTYQFLDSIKLLSYTNLEVYLVDNGSLLRPLDEKRIREIIPGAFLIKSKVNLGFGAGNNLAIRQSFGDYVFIVNNDTIVSPNLIEELLAPFAEDDKVGVVCPKILYFDHPELIQYAGFTEIHPFTGRNQCIGFQENDIGQHDIELVTGGAHGAAMMVSRKVIENTGAFYEPYFLYYEETDWSSRIIKAGYKIVYQPKARIYHKESVSVGKNSTMKTFYLTRNRLLYMKRNSPAIRYFIFVLFYFLISVPKNTIKYMIKGEGQHLKAFINGTFKGLSISAGTLPTKKLQLKYL